MSVSTPPSDTASVQSLTESKRRLPASMPPLSPKLIMVPGPFMIRLHTSCCTGGRCKGQGMRRYSREAWQAWVAGAGWYPDARRMQVASSQPASLLKAPATS